MRFDFCIVTLGVKQREREEAEEFKEGWAMLDENDANADMRFIRRKIGSECDQIAEQSIQGYRKRKTS